MGGEGAACRFGSTYSEGEGQSSIVSNPAAERKGGEGATGTLSGALCLSGVVFNPAAEPGGERRHRDELRTLCD